MFGERRIALAIGDTAGHFYPALAVVEAYRRRFPGTDALFIGPEGVGARLAADHGYASSQLVGAPLTRSRLRAKIAALYHNAVGTAQARAVLARHRSRLALGFGGYASAEVLLAARTLGVRTAIHEANIRPGLANRLLGSLVDRIYLAFPEAGDRFPAARLLVTGLPVRDGIGAASRKRSTTVDDRQRPIRVLVTSGSRGADFLARHLPEALATVTAGGRAVEVQHQIDALDPEPVERAYARAHVRATLVPFISDMAAAYRWADVAIARAGAGTIAELARAEVPALLVPLGDAADDHQTANAREFARARGGVVMAERDWQSEIAGRLIATLIDGLGDGARRGRSPRLVVPDAAERIVDDCEALMEGRW